MTDTENKIFKLRDDVADILSKNKLTATEVIQIALMLLSSAIHQGIKKEALENKKDPLTKLLALADDVLGKCGIVRADDIKKKVKEILKHGQSTL